MPRALKATSESRRSAVSAAPPGVPLLREIEANDLMLATLYPRPFSQENWLYELKYDGFRCAVRKRGTRMELISRQGNLFNASFPDVLGAVAAIPGDFVLDAELTVDEPNGRSSFERLQKRARTSNASRVKAAAAAHPARLYVFDILSIGDRDLRGLVLAERKAILRDCFADTPVVVAASGIVAAGEWVFQQAVKLDLEGILAKRLDSTYQGGRSHDWRKVKNQSYSRPAAVGFGRISAK